MYSKQTINEDIAVNGASKICLFSLLFIVAVVFLQLMVVNSNSIRGVKSGNRNNTI